MSKTALFNYKTFDIESIVYDTPSLVRGNCFLAKNKGPNRILFQTPKLISINSIELDQKGCYLELQLSEEDKEFYDFLQNIDEKNITHAHKSSNEWFQNSFTYETIDDFYIPTVKHKSSETVANLNYIKIRIPVQKRVPNINIYDDKRDKIDWKRIQTGTIIVAILELKGLKFLQKEVICDWEIVQLKASIEKSKVNLTKILIDLSKEDETVNNKSDVNISEDYEDCCDVKNNTTILSNHDELEINEEPIIKDETTDNTTPIICDNSPCNIVNVNTIIPKDAESKINKEELEKNDSINKETTNKINTKIDTTINSVNTNSHKEKKVNNPSTINNYNEKVIDPEMVSELAKVPEINSKQHVNKGENSEISSAISYNDLLLENNHYKIKEKREDLIKVMKEADEASRKADFLRNQAVEAVAQIKNMCSTISLEENIQPVSQTY